MQNKYPLWKYLLFLAIAVFAFLYALPNIYGEDPAIQISTIARSEQVVDNALKDKVTQQLKMADFDFKSITLKANRLLIRFNSTDTQLHAKDSLKEKLGNEYIVASSLAPATPHWLEAIGATPMRYGLDLRGGVHFLLEVDLKGVVARREAGMSKQLTEDLRAAKIRYRRITQLKQGGVLIKLRNLKQLDDAYALIKRSFPNMLLVKENTEGRYNLVVRISPVEMNNIRQYTIEQTMTTLRNRINELGVGESVVQQQGANRVAVDLPGIQDATRAKQILGGTATLEFRMVDEEHDARGAQTGMIPMGSSLYEMQGRPILLKNQVLLSGDSITSAVSSFDQQSAQPSVQISLAGGETQFSRTTRRNVGKRMAIVYVETKTKTEIKNGKEVRSSYRTERVISAPVIQSALGANFQITGLSDIKESRNLALLLRAGALPTTIYYVEERIIGPSLGVENIRRGIISLEVGLGIILVLMLVYYHSFGFIANFALVLNLVLLVAALSIIGAVLTLPGIAGIVLTMGMAVDANVLINERIREEIRNGATPQAAIFAGYERAFATIVDANVTTFIVAIVLFAIGTGAVKGFAVTVSIGLLTSMLTGVGYTRAIVNLRFGRKGVAKLPIGI